MRVLSMYGSLLAAGLRGTLQYRANFVIEVITGLTYQGTGFVFIWVVLTRFPTIAGWNLGAVAFLYGLRLLISSTTEIVFPYLQIIRQIRMGEFDRYLVRPFPSLLQMMTARVQVSLFGDFLGGISLFVAANLLAGVSWTPLALAYLLLAIVGGCMVQASMMLCVVALSFRLLSTGMLAFLIDDLVTTFGNYPLTIYPGVVRALLTFGAPIAFMAYFPATVLLSRTGELSVPPLLAYLSPLVGAALFAATYRLMQHETRHYQSSGH